MVASGSIHDAVRGAIRRAALHTPPLAALAAALLLAPAPAALAQVDLTVGLLEDGAAITIEFDVAIEQPVTAGAAEVCNQGTVLGSNVTPDVATDDPATGAPPIPRAPGSTPSPT